MDRLKLIRAKRIFDDAKMLLEDSHLSLDEYIKVDGMIEYARKLKNDGLRGVPHAHPSATKFPVAQVICKYCGRKWPDKQVKCWDGVDGCGASL